MNKYQIVISVILVVRAGKIGCPDTWGKYISCQASADHLLAQTGALLGSKFAKYVIRMPDEQTS